MTYTEALIEALAGVAVIVAVHILRKRNLVIEFISFGIVLFGAQCLPESMMVISAPCAVADVVILVGMIFQVCTGRLE